MAEKFALDSDLLRQGPIQMLTLLSYEMNLYLVKLDIGGKSGIVYENGRPKHFHSIQKVRDTFAEYDVTAAQMLQDSPYDEMIGNPQPAQSNSFLPLSWPVGLSS